MKNSIFLLLGAVFVYLGVQLIGNSFMSDGSSSSGDLSPKLKQGVAFSPEVAAWIKEERWEELVPHVASLSRPSRGDRAALALAHLEMGLYDEVLRITDELLQGDQAEAFLRRLQVWALLKRGELDKADSYIDSWQATYPKDGNAYYAAGYSLWQRKKIEEAAPVLDKAIALGCDEKEDLNRLLRDIYFHLGKKAEDAQNIKKAIIYLEKCVALNPSQANYYFRLGKLYVAQKQGDKALMLFKNSLEKEKNKQLEEAIYDEIRLMYHSRAFNASLEKRYQEALDWARLERQYVKVKSHRRNVDGFIKNNSKLYVEQLRKRAYDSPKSMEIWKELLNHDPMDPEARWEVSRTLPVEERLLVEQALMNGPWEAEVSRRRAEEFWELEQKQEACRWMIRHHQIINGRDKMAAEQKLFVWLKELETYSDEMNSKSWEQVWRLFRLKAGSDKWRSQMQRVNRLFPERFFIWIYQAEVLLEQGELNQFNKLADEIISLDPPQKAMIDLKHLRQRFLLPE